MRRVVLDTNILVSAFLFFERGGVPVELLRKADDHVARDEGLAEVDDFAEDEVLIMAARRSDRVGGHEG